MTNADSPKYYTDGQWVSLPHIGGGALGHIKAGYYEALQEPEYDVIIQHGQLLSLIEYARNQGLVPLVMTPQSREEDLKVVHRLIDLLERP